VSEPYLPDVPFVDSVLHPTDFSEMSTSAFAHALSIALIRQTKLTLLHAGGARAQSLPWTQFPSVRETLERWSLLEPGSPRSAVFEQLAIRVRKVVLDAPKPLDAILAYLAKNPADLIVLATRGLDGLPRWIEGSVAEPLARRSGSMTLFCPGGGRGFVSASDGSWALQRILVPIDHTPDPAAAIEYAARAARATGGPVEIALLHVAGSGRPPQPRVADEPACRWSRLVRRGDVVEELVAAAAELSADLIVMPTEGHQGILDALRGSITERVLRRAACPVLAVPATRLAGA